MVYTPTGEEFTIDTSSLKVDRPKASWYSPLSGTYHVFQIRIPVDTEMTFMPPAASGHLDCILVLEGID